MLRSEELTRLYQDAHSFDDRITALEDITRMEAGLAAATAQLRARLQADAAADGAAADGCSRSWPTPLLQQALRVSYLDVERSAKIIRALVCFRRDQGWPLTLCAAQSERAVRARRGSTRRCARSRSSHHGLVRHGAAHDGPRRAVPLHLGAARPKGRRPRDGAPLLARQHQERDRDVEGLPPVRGEAVRGEADRDHRRLRPHLAPPRCRPRARPALPQQRRARAANQIDARALPLELGRAHRLRPIFNDEPSAPAPRPKPPPAKLRRRSAIRWGSGRTSDIPESTAVVSPLAKRSSSW
jgi:hypothetical protein